LLYTIESISGSSFIAMNLADVLLDATLLQAECMEHAR
jgi:hypothetical protein